MMKLFTKKFLKRIPKEDASFGNISHNAKEAEKRIGIPQKLYKELSMEFPQSNLKKGCGINTIFMAGVVVGFVEKNNKIK